MTSPKDTPAPASTPAPGRAAAGPGAAGSASDVVAAPAGGALQSSRGSTHISETVVSTIAGRAAREVPGVHDLGGGAARAWGALRERIPGGSANASQGVSVEVGERQAAVEVHLVVEYGTGIAELARAVRRSIIGSLEQMTGLEVVGVDITVDDVHLPSRETGSAAGSGRGTP
jgi:uncharacterized alkaline shock family protein YloU